MTNCLNKRSTTHKDCLNKRKKNDCNYFLKKMIVRNATRKLLLKKIYISDNAADMLTELVTADKFKYCLDLINVSSC